MFDQYAPPKARKRGRWLRRLLWLVVGAALFVQVGINVALATSLGPTLMNLAPDAVQIRYRKARMPYPFRVEVEGFELFNQDGNIQMVVTAERATARLHPLAAVGIHILVTDIDAEGVVFRLRQRLREPPSKAELERLPPIEAFPDVMRPKVDVMPPFFPLVDLPDMVVRDVRELWIDDYRYQGRIDVRGGFTLKPMEYLSLHHVVAEVDGGVVHFGEKQPLAVKPSRLEAHVDAVPVPTSTRADWKRIWGRADLEAEVASARWLNTYLAPLPGFRVQEGAGVLTVHAGLDAGVIVEDSHFSLVTRRATVQVPHVDVQGKAVIRGAVERGHPALHITMDGVRVERKEDQVPMVSDGHFTLVGRTTSVDLSSPQHLHAHLTLAGARSGSLTFLNRYIPASAGLTVYAGEGTVHGEASLSEQTLHGKGSLRIDATQLVLKNRSAVLSGQAVVEGAFPHYDLRTGAVELSGSRVTFRKVGVSAASGQYKDFWLDLLVSKGVRTREDRWDATVAMKFSNLQPVLGVIAANFSLPQVLVAFANIPDIYARGDLAVEKGDIKMTGLLVEGKGLEAKANIELKEVPPKGVLSPFGAALVKVPLLAVGLELKGQQVVPQLLGAEAWYTRLHPEETR